MLTDEQPALPHARAIPNYKTEPQRRLAGEERERINRHGGIHLSGPSNGGVGVSVFSEAGKIVLDPSDVSGGRLAALRGGPGAWSSDARP